jgi:uncharacterized protein YecE (DUF72 family)
VLGGLEINSSFHRPHRVQTYERWAASTPDGFRFAVKLPKQITHVLRLQEVQAPLDAFVAEAGCLGTKWAVALVQLPPSLALDVEAAAAFFVQLHPRFTGAVVCEPRHPSWFTPQADALLREWRVSRAGADPARWPAAAEPGGWLALVRYHRWHGSPQMYRSSYDDGWLAAKAAALQAGLSAPGETWCIFDNTASGAALPNALRLGELLGRANAMVR